MNPHTGERRVPVSLARWFRTRRVEPDVSGKMPAVLGAGDLVLLGIGAVIGAGVFVLNRVVAATQAGPALTLSFLVAGLACAFAALSYAELAASVGGCGSAYGYAYAGLGELVAWIIGWALVLDTASPFPRWRSAGPAIGMLAALGIELPPALLAGPTGGGIVNLPAVMIIVILGVLLAVGMRSSARFNSVMVLIKLSAITAFVVIAVPNVDTSNWTPFLPFGYAGVIHGAALIFSLPTSASMRSRPPPRNAVIRRETFRSASSVRWRSAP